MTVEISTGTTVPVEQVTPEHFNLKPLTLEHWQRQLIAGLNPSSSTRERELISHTLKQDPRRIEIYRGNIKQALINALHQSFPTVRHCVGKDTFMLLCTQYVLTQTLNDKNLNHFGHQFDQLIKQLPNEIHHHLSLEYLADIAALDWLKQKSYYAKSDRAMEHTDFGALAALGQEEQAGVLFSLRCHIECYASPYYLSQHLQQPVQRSFSTTVSDTVSATAQTNEETPQSSYYYLVSRNADSASSFDYYHPQVSLITQSEFQLIKAMKQNIPLANLIELSWLPSLQELLFSFTEKGWIKGFKVQPPGAQHV